jgi:hypothetical protein
MRAWGEDHHERMAKMRGWRKWTRRVAVIDVNDCEEGRKIRVSM